jgi:hypothetical protein
MIRQARHYYFWLLWTPNKFSLTAWSELFRTHPVGTLFTFGELMTGATTLRLTGILIEISCY